jgi:hypothetical protein
MSVVTASVQKWFALPKGVPVLKPLIPARQIVWMTMQLVIRVASMNAGMEFARQ